MYNQAFVQSSVRAAPRLAPSADLIPTHQEHYWLSEYLAGIALEDGTVDWRAIRPEEFHPSIFPHLVLFDVVEDDDGNAVDFVYRVMGDRLIEFAKVNMTGKPLSKFPIPNIRDSVMNLAHRAHETQQPVFSNTRSSFDYEKSLMTERSFYPVTRNGRPCVLALITVTKPPIPFADLFSAATLPPAEIEHFRVLETPHAWV